MKKPKRVAMISYHTCPLASVEGKETGGMNVYVLELSKKLGDEKIYVDIFTRSENTHSEPVVQINPYVRLIHVVAGPQKHLSKKHLSPYRDEFVKNIYEYAHKNNSIYDIIHCHYYLSGLIGLILLKRFQHARFIMTFHTLGLMKNLVARDSLEKETTKRIDSEMLLTQKADHIVALSETDREYISYLYNCNLNKISVVSPGVDADFFYPVDKTIARKKIGADINHKLLLFVGRIEPLKGIDSLLYAIKILLSKNRHMHNVCLWIVGGDVSQHKQLWSHELQKLERLRQLLGLRTSVHFVGKQPQSMLPLYYSASDIVVMPSHYETFGIVALEAMACGTPVISTHVAGISRLFDTDDDSIVPANSPLHLASQIESLLTDREKYQASKKQVLTKVHKLSWAHTSKNMLEVYERILMS